MTAFADLLDLRTAVIEHVGTAAIADVFPRLVLLAEAGFNRGLRMRNQITTAPLTFASGEAALPSDFAEMIGVFNASGCEYLQQTPASVQSGGAWYAIEGDTIIAPLINGALTAKYYAQIPTLTASMATTNWLLAKYPSVYLYGVGLEAAKHIKDGGIMQVTAQLLADAMTDAKADDDSARFSRTRVRVAGCTP